MEHKTTAHATIEIAPDTKSRVEKLAADTNRSAQDIVTEAVEAYLEFETDYLRRVRRGVARHRVEPMAAIVKIPSPLARRLTNASIQTRRSPDAIARTALDEHLSYLEWRAQAIDEGFTPGTRDGWLSSETVMKNFAKRQAAFAKKKRSKAA